MSSHADYYRLWQHENGAFYVIWTEGRGTKRLSARTDNRDEAERFRAQLIAGLDNPAPPPNPSIDYLLDRYFSDHALKTRSIATIAFHVRVLKMFFGKLLPEHVTNKSLSDYVQFRRSKKVSPKGKDIPEQISDGTILREIGTLKAALRFAEGNRWIAPLPKFQSPLQQPPARDLWLSKEQAQKLIEAAKSEHIRLFILIGLSTAARTGAILDLKWEQVDMERRLIDFGRGWGNKRRAIVPINDDLYDAFVSTRELAQSDHVIEYKSKGVASIKSAFKRLSKDTNIKASPHVLRHTAATWLVMDGVPLSEVARLLGDSEKTVEKVYGKHAPGYLKRAVSALSFSKRNLESYSAESQALRTENNNLKRANPLFQSYLLD